MSNEQEPKELENTVEEQENENLPKTKKPFYKKIWFWAFIIILIFVFKGCGNSQKKVVDLGEDIEVEDVVCLNFEKGLFSEEAVYPLNAIQENSGIRFSGDGTMFAIYGNVKNISSIKYDLNKVCKVKLVVDNEYESNAKIWLENDERTIFPGFNAIEDAAYLSPDAIMNPKDENYCTIIGKVGDSVYAEAEEIELIIEILTDVDDDKVVTYCIPLLIDQDNSTTGGENNSTQPQDITNDILGDRNGVSGNVGGGKYVKQESQKDNNTSNNNEADKSSATKDNAQTSINFMGKLGSYEPKTMTEGFNGRIDFGDMVGNQIPFKIYVFEVDYDVFSANATVIDKNTAQFSDGNLTLTFKWTDSGTMCITNSGEYAGSDADLIDITTDNITYVWSIEFN